MRSDSAEATAIMATVQAIGEAAVDDDEADEQSHHHHERERVEAVLPEHDPERVSDTGNGEPPAGGAHGGVVLLFGQSLKDSEPDERQIDQAPDGEDVAGRDEEEVETIRDLGGGAAAEGQSRRQPIEDERGHQR